MRLWPVSISAVWLTLPILGILVAASLEPIPPHDYWWHLVMGRHIALTGHIPSTNLFLYTLPADLPFQNQPWLGQLAMYRVFELLGHGGGVWVRNALLAVALGLVAFAGLRRSDSARAVGGLTLVAGLVAYPVLTVRTRMFAFVPFAAILYLCVGYLEGRLSRRWLVLVPPLTALWANLHGSFVLGPAVVGACAAGALWERLVGDNDSWSRAVDLGATTVAAVVAGSLTPLGLGTYQYVFGLTVTSSVARSVSEWMPPDVQTFGGVVFLAVAVASLLLLASSRERVRVHEALLFAGPFYLAAGAERSAFWWAMVLPVVLAPHLGRRLPETPTEETPRAMRLNAALVALGLAALAMTLPGLGRGAAGAAMDAGKVRRSGEGQYVLNHEHAFEAIAALGDARRVFHDQALGGMLEFFRVEGGEPRQVAFVDQRMEFVPDSVWQQFFAISDASNTALLDDYGVDALLLSASDQWPLVQWASASPDWVLVETDQSHLVFRRVTRSR